MNHLLLKNNYIQAILSFILIMTFLIIYYPINKTSGKSLLTLSENDTSSISLDINGDGIVDNAYIKNSKIYLNLNKKTFCLNDFFQSKTIISAKSWPIKVYFKKISRKNSYDIIVEAMENSNKNCIMVFSFNNDMLEKKYESNNNIFGILNLNTSKTPECFSLNSSCGNNSKDSFMIISNKKKDITKNSHDIPDIDAMLKLVNIIEADYEINETNDIFSPNISSEELGILWNLNKEYNHYSFQNAYFENNSYDSKGELKSIKWTLSFEKYPLGKDDSYKKEIIFNVITEKCQDTFKISSITNNNKELNLYTTYKKDH
ncbi:hypothetical protein ACTNDG_09175 [Clostridium sp. HCP1S3_B4]|uniref:hypothetical protein n=1 Tax=unclassified Clostridium TaxID=2614128 RepID=UPI003F8B7597